MTFAGNVIAEKSGLSFSGDNAVLWIMETGSFTSFEDLPGNSAVYLGHTDGSVINDGQLSSLQSVGVLVAGNSTITNRGTIDAASGVFLGRYGGSGGVVINSGQISANSYGDASNDARYNNGVISQGPNSVIVNLAGGIISAVGTEGAGVRLNGYANQSTVENGGEIVSLNFYGVSFQGLTLRNTATLLNTGSISGSVGSFEGSPQADVVTNQGVMNGDVVLGGGADVFDGRGGIVNGSILGGAGNDTYIVDGGSALLVETVGEGKDTVRAATTWILGDNFENLDLIGTGNIRGIGNDLRNTIAGNSGDNRLSGKGGKDTLSGGDGDDLILGGGDRDILNGGGGDDTLRGGSSKDSLSGGDGNDVLIGGLGTDVMTGGDGKDVFVFNRKVGFLRASPSDSITDFVIGEDRVDLSGLHPSLSYIDGNAFSGAAGEVQVTLRGGNSLIKIDVDGDSSWDMKIVVDAVTGLSVADFIL